MRMLCHDNSYHIVSPGSCVHNWPKPSVGVCVYSCPSQGKCSHSKGESIFLFFSLTNNRITGASHTQTHTQAHTQCPAPVLVVKLPPSVMRAQLSVCNDAQTFGPSLHRILLLLFHVDPLNRIGGVGHWIDVRDGGLSRVIHPAALRT